MDISLGERIEELFFSSKKRLLGVLAVLILLLSIPVTYQLLNQQQDVRQQASRIADTCTATTLKGFDTSQQQSACNSGATSYSMTVTCGDNATFTKVYQCNTDNTSLYSPDAAAICSARTALCTPTPLPTTPLPSPIPITCGKTQDPTAQPSNTSSTQVTFDMKSPIYGVTDGPITDVKYISGNWCAWRQSDTVHYATCPVLCPHAPGAGYPFTIAPDRRSFSSDFDYPYADNSGSCTYEVTCTASVTITPTPSLSPAPSVSPTPSIIVSPTSAPTSTPVPSPTPDQPGAQVALDATFPGIGQDVGRGENNSPRHKDRQFTVFLYDNQGKQAGKTTATLTFNGISYKGVAKFPGVPAGSYIVKLRADDTLVRAIPGVRQLILASPVTTPQVILISGDISTGEGTDNVLDLTDYNRLLMGFGTSSPDSRISGDLNDDGTVNSKDLNILFRGFATRKGD